MMNIAPELLQVGVHPRKWAAHDQKLLRIAGIDT